MRRKPLIAALTMGACLIGAAPALAMPGDSEIASSNPFRLDGRHLEPGCFVAGSHGMWQDRDGRDVDVDSHLVYAKKDGISEEVHISVEDGAPFSIDQVLIASRGDGYVVYNQFDTGTVNNDPDIDPGQTATGLVGNLRFIDEGGTIVCVSGDHASGDNRPYSQEDHGRVSAHRPILTPKVTAFGVSAISNLKTYRIGFGYGASGFNKYQDAIALFPRADGDYDGRRVNDVDKAGESWANLFNVTDEEQANFGQTFLFHSSGDMTAWADSRITLSEGRNLLTYLTQGDLPMSWTLRPTLAPPNSKRTATFTLADFFAWNKAWQDYYKGGKLPAMPLAPGTNSPAPDTSVTVVVNPPLTQPAPTPSNPAPAVVVNPTPVTVTAPVTNNSGANNGSVKSDDTCKSNRVITFSWPKGDKKTHIRYWNKTANGKMSNGRMRATADFRGYVASRGDLLKVTQLSRRHGHNVSVQRVFKAC